MTTTNIYDTEDLIVNRIADLFDESLIFTDGDSGSLDNEVFDKIDSEPDKVAVMVLQAGFQTDPLVGNNRNPTQRLKVLWQIVIASPIDSYKTYAGPKMIEVAKLLKGYRLSKEIGIMQLVDDERGFNRPDMADGHLAYLPMMFSVEVII